ncbi:hydrogen peroxide-inducible genes activator [Pseudogemmobacter bohemicus]|uniref:hydrogen peroxide-inducible genes activator n=1 Tax=Pseudogemmobacter bohemicus TaxID=2250708 RepID=UPI000DD4AE58|nr:hydrogen peroxide-inducible genes activator [Pseudogemmobacter bohemicus]
MPTLQQLRYLVAVADQLNFSRAAEICNVAQPTLSMQLRALEERLGARLVERNRARVSLTPLGREVARRARTVIDGIEDIREVARRGDPEAPQAALRIGVVQTVGAYVLSVAMPGLRAAWPEMRINVREEHPETLIRQLLEGVFDVILLGDELRRDDVEQVPLITEPMLAVIPAGHRLAGLAEIQPSELAGETVLAFDGGPALRRAVTRLCSWTGARLARDYEGTTLDTLRQMVATGMGISLLPALYVRSEVLREQLVVARPLSEAALTRQITMVWRRDAPRRRSYAAIAAAFRESLMPWHADPLHRQSDSAS